MDNYYQKKKMDEPVVVTNHVTKEYFLQGRKDTVKALDDIHLAEDSPFPPIRKGEFVMLRGPSGGGKTSLLNILGTIDKPTSGYIELFGTRIDSNSSDKFLSELRLKKIGFVFQTFNLLATLSSYENVELPMTILGKLTKKEQKIRAIELLTMVGLQDRLNHLPSELSGGEQQRVTIARALANDPDILLLDEPTGDLDTKNTIEIMDLLLDINIKRKTTCIMVTHNPDIECYADRILYLSDGKFEKQVYNSEQTPLIYEEYIKYLNKIEQ
jgi:putative ABC transport system ATP-binding protein